MATTLLLCEVDSFRVRLAGPAEPAHAPAQRFTTKAQFLEELLAIEGHAALGLSEATGNLLFDLFACMLLTEILVR